MLKGFYKPNKLKVILVIMIMIIHIALGVFGFLSNFCIENYDGHHINDCPETTIVDKILLVFSMLLLIPLGITIIGITGNPLFALFARLAGITILIFFWYTLSCTFVKIKSRYYS